MIALDLGQPERPMPSGWHSIEKMRSVRAELSALREAIRAEAMRPTEAVRLALAKLAEMNEQEGGAA